MASPRKISSRQPDNQSRDSFIPPQEVVMAYPYDSSVDSVIYHEITKLVSCPLDELARRLPADSWGQVFEGGGRARRQGAVRLSLPSRFSYALSVGSDPSLPSLRETGEARSCVDGVTDSHRGKK